MRFIILKGGVIVDVAGTLHEAKNIAFNLLPPDFKKGDSLKPSEYVSIFKFVENYGG